MARLRRSCLISLVAGSTAFCISVNRTIDDEKGDSVTGVVPSYSPAGSWSQGVTCDGCFVHLDPSRAYDGTWHDSTHTPGDPEPRVITAHFTGTAVYVYNVLANTVPYTTTFTSLTFTLDGASAGQFVHVPTDSTAFQYDVPVFAKAGLSNADHTIVIEATGDTNSSLVLFDYIVYTFEDQDTGTPSRPTSATPSTTSTPTQPLATSSTDTTTQGTTSSDTAIASTGGVTSGDPKSSHTSANTSSSVSTIGHASSPQPPSPSSSTSQAPASGGTGTPGVAVTSPQDKQSNISPGVIAGGVVGGVAVVALTALLASCLLRRRRRPTGPGSSDRIISEAPETHAVNASGAENNTAFYGTTLQNGATARFTSSMESPFADSEILHTVRPMPQRPGPSADASRQFGRGDEAVALPPNPASNLDIRRPYVSTTGGGSFSPSIPGNINTPSSSQPFLPTVTYIADEKSPLVDGDRLGGDLEGSVSGTRSDYDGASSVGTSTLRAQVAVLQQEVERLREQQEMQRLFEEIPPPRYDDT